MDEIKEAAKAYTKGAVIGGVIGAFFALATRKRVIIFGGMGVLIGGFIAHTMVKSKNEGLTEKPGFKNYDATN